MADVPPFSELAQFTLDRASLRLLPESFCRRNKVAVLGKVDPAAEATPVTVGMVQPDNRVILELISDFLRRPLTPVRLNHYEVESALEVGFGAGPRVTADLTLKAHVPLSSAPSAVELVDHVLATAVELKASDIHVEGYFDDVDLRYRIDGILHQSYTDIDPRSLPEVVSRIKLLAGLDITERRRPQDGRFRALLEGTEGRKLVDFRVSVVPSPVGEDVVIRILDSDVGLVPVEKLGMSPALQATFLQLLSNPEGLVLVTGPTGSGKTTTLYSALARLNDGRRKIITAEDPIEYYVPKVNQKQVTQQMPHMTLLRAMLRQDPNVMLVGEVRDLETGSMALTAAATGHVVLGTLHTADAVGAVARLRGLKLDDVDIGDSLLAVLAQRLVRRICEKCVEPVPPTPEQEALLGELLRGVQPHVGRGCEACHHTGYRGRSGIFELMVVDPDLQDLISRGEPTGALRRHARQHGLRTLVEDALDKVSAKTTTLAELVRVIPYRHILTARDELAGAK
ncbi:type II/IV secretion system protein [Pyxidicoccus fallax]|uniref:Type II/IV secretion system protein n=1 Tax=Pyxidicoccus fallax TaxID=394095 RepID=A0A848LTP3_9BACT|nr:GspE/PulE family protein [Pyxidicoccus fallax]NMO21039.1 type II/IV secretion system protein [Pyxidicoccus fallax]NPC80402.1 type II/IV secretion system protein [Pyxidicoccus fallax]